MNVNQYLEVFLDEARDHLRNLKARIRELENDPEEMEIVNEIFRATHSLKGMAGTMGYREMESLAGEMENVLSDMRDGNLRVCTELLDHLCQCLDALEGHTHRIQDSGAGGSDDNGQKTVPFERLADIFYGMIRDLSGILDKKLALYMTGGQTELDRAVADGLAELLMHLLRNCADHGIEAPDIRVERGKPPTGSIFLDAYRDGASTVIEVRDDGRGIDTEAVRRRAIARGFITPQQARDISEGEILNLLFLPGFSTAARVTNISGRGVGLDVVRTKIEALGGTVEVRTKPGEGSRFLLKLPKLHII